ncbi:ubiquitin domain-containing protein UBFD1-like isoform X1 [Pogonomyrmex barbatus]|uniref:Ubiquitin domain-containing protein UBFD1-like isoform X1 n=1 Tax=Pogonomyrmex barbatus TaxID=144034 RepID=A0A6I9WR97_9HYME|nr:ubiquitin domain-containing protein UBFD1-like isoform X1 [Pogonomyrmex barbatus]
MCVCVCRIIFVTLSSSLSETPSVYLRHGLSSIPMQRHTAKNDNNDSCCNSSPCPELTSNSKSIENSATDTKESTMESENNITVLQDTSVTTLQEPSTENVDFTAIYNKQKISINFALDSTVAELKTHLQKIISVPQAMQKVMFKGLAKDDQTLRNLGVTKGAKIMIVGSKLDDVLAVSIPTKQDLIDETVSSVSKEPLSQQKIHRKVLDKGIPEDVMPGILDSKEPLPEFPLAGMLNKSGGKVRLTFKLEQDQLWIGTKERTDKIPMNSIKGVHSEPIHDHPEYHIMAIQLGTTEASRYWIYWVPAQYISAIKDAILYGKWCYF